MDTAINFDKYQSVLNKTYFKKLGKVENVVGLTIESAGPDAKMGDMCRHLLEYGLFTPQCRINPGQASQGT